MPVGVPNRSAKVEAGGPVGRQARRLATAEEEMEGGFPSIAAAVEISLAVVKAFVVGGKIAVARARGNNTAQQGTWKGEFFRLEWRCLNPQIPILLRRHCQPEFIHGLWRRSFSSASQAGQ